MARIRHLFIFKCAKGHVMQKTYPLGTRFDDYDETTCLECLKKIGLRPSYLIFAEPVPDKEQ
jgi:hypothetical protein